MVLGKTRDLQVFPEALGRVRRIFRLSWAALLEMMLGA